MNQKLERRYAELVQALLERDTSQRCPLYCSKKEWGPEQHDADCPFSVAYAIQEMEEVKIATTEVQQWLVDHPIVYDWPSGSKLTYPDVDSLVDLDVHAMWELETEFANRIIMGPQYDEYVIRAIESTDNEDRTDAILQQGPVVSWDMNMRRLIRNTRPYLALQVYSADMVQHQLSRDGSIWSNLPQEVDGSIQRVKLVSDEEVTELRNNAFYDGPIVALLDGDTLTDIWDWLMDGKINQDSMVVLQPGALVTIHNYGVGASSVLAETIAPIRVKLSGLIHDGSDDYGIQACCGLVKSVWRGHIDLVEQDE